MYQRFEQRGYKKETLDKALTKAKKLDRNALLYKTSATKQQSSKIFCSLQYSNMAYNIKNIVNKNWNILLSDAFLGSVFSEPPDFCFRRAPTLNDSLVRSHLPAPKSKSWFPQPKGTYRCGSCKHCHNIKRDNVFFDVFSKKTFHCRSFANCNTTRCLQTWMWMWLFLCGPHKKKAQRRTGRTQIRHKNSKPLLSHGSTLHHCWSHQFWHFEMYGHWGYPQ